MATVRQKIATKLVLNGMPITRAMKKANYAPKTAANTTKLTQTKGFQELIDKYISEEKLAKVHAEGLNATRKEGDEKVADYAVRHKYLETGYKVRGKLKDNVQPGTTNNIIILADEQRARIARRAILRASGSEESPDRLPDSDQS